MSPFRSTACTWLAVAALTSGGVSQAAGPSWAEATRYQDEKAVCPHIRQDRAACLREAGAARQEAQRGGLTGAPDYMSNALARCEPHPPAERAACEQRVRGTGATSIEGSVLGGGLIRETVTPLVPAAR